ncbi:MAG: ribosome maturation factor RimP [Thermoleophilia bacterium]|nr:ribosome maturation factor RimP [Thermoleophilia bacterium]
MAHVHERERELQREVAGKVGSRLPDVEVLAVELRGEEELCVFLDRPTGVDHALCEQVTGILREYLERYALEVSSPGLARPLRTQEHFRKAVGRRVAVRTPARRTKLRGEVVEAGETEVTLSVGGGRVAVPYDEIVRGNLIDEG